MKKRIFLIILLFCCFGFTTKINAEEIAKCTYKISLGTQKNITFSLTVNDDQSITYSHSTKDGLIKDSIGEHYWRYYNIKEYANALYDGEKVASSCPKLVVGQPLTGQSYIYVYYGEESSNFVSLNELINVEETSGILDVLKKGTAVDTKKEVHYCTRTKQIDTFKDHPLAFDFYKDKDGIRKVKVYSTKESGASTSFAVGEAGGLIIGGISFSIFFDSNEDNIAPFFESKNSCEKADMWLNGTQSSFYITTEKPGLGQNAADLNGEKDDGSDYKDPEEGKGASNGNWDPGEYCGDNGEKCNIDITEFCTNRYVSRTLKFLGLLLQIAKILVPAIIIVLGFVDLIKIIMAGKVDEVKKQAKNIFIRVVLGAVIFLLPTVLITIFNVANNIANGNSKEENASGTLDVPVDFENCVNCILEPDKCLIMESD